MMMTLLSEASNMVEIYRTELICEVGVCVAAVLVVVIAYFVILEHLESRAAQEALMVIGTLAILLVISILACKVCALGKLESTLKGSAAVIETTGELLLQNRF